MVLIDLLVLVAFGSATLFVAFLFAYGFHDVVGAPEHEFFLGLWSVSTIALGLVTGLVDGALLSNWRRGFVVGIALSIAAHCVALAGGVLVSLANEDQNSVTADQADAPFVALVVVALVVAGVSAAWASRTLRSR